MHAMHATPKTTTHNWYNGRRGQLGPERAGPLLANGLWLVLALCPLPFFRCLRLEWSFGRCPALTSPARGR